MKYLLSKRIVSAYTNRFEIIWEVSIEIEASSIVPSLSSLARSLRGNLKVGRHLYMESGI